MRSPAAAARALAPEWRRVFLALGRDRLAPFRGQTGRLLLVRAPGRAAAPKGAAAPPGLARAVFLADPGPYDAAGEARLFRRLRVDAVVARNAGGPEAWPKMAAARRLGLPVVLLDPPSRPSGALDDPAAALARLRALAGTEPALALPRRDA